MGVLYFFFWGDCLGFEPIAPLGAAVLICNQEKMLNKRFFARLTTQCGDNARHTASKELIELSVSKRKSTTMRRLRTGTSRKFLPKEYLAIL